MNEINELLKYSESEKVEFKKSTAQLEKGLKAVCGFLNHKGGSVYFGIHGGKVVGQEVSDSTLRSISQKIRQKIKPEISPEITVLGTGKEKVIEVKVKEGLNKPCYLNGIAYKRVGTENSVIPPEELERIIMERRKNQWDKQISPDADFKDMDEEKVRWFLKEGIRQKRMNIPEDTPADDILMRIKLSKDGRLTNAAVLLFSKEPEFIQSGVKCIVLPTTEFVKPYTSYCSYEGTLFDQVDKSLVFVLENIHRPLWLEPGKASAKNPYEIPEDAVRECIVNAVVHRDYESPSKVQVRIFPDRVEIWNPGSLPGQLKIDDLKKPHPSIPKNSLIFRQLYRAGYVEDAGGGTTDVIMLCRDNGLPEPKFEEKMGCFVVTIWRNKYADTYIDRFNLNERQRKAIEYLKKQGKINRRTYCQICNVEKTVAYEDLLDMVNKGIIYLTGKGRGTYYTLRT
ncbi:hypothetical protein BEH94_01400 [Candidatus Altiarchaeales archaeon WOR_SM1_SCG]|nr:hypothetical protein BEH94_01400 [Candidatus Altiarchaeales archaeon WOR_SM1_SCG]